MADVAQGDVWRADLPELMSFLTERVARLGPKPRAQILHGIDVMLGR